METPTLRTQRLLLRPWQDPDREPFAALNSDPQVMEHFPATLSRGQSDAFVDRIAAQFEDSGWGLWAAEVTDGSTLHGDFIGFVGLWPADHVESSSIEVGWRLAKRAWGRGYAPEAAAEALRYGFEVVGMEEILSFTVPENGNSRRVMEKVGLRRRIERDFEHPNVDPEVHPQLVPHVMYAIDRAEWQASQQH
ncbi:MAG: GNAT family N-acetyltransferase [Microthrixaceae bacterium]